MDSTLMQLIARAQGPGGVAEAALAKHRRKRTYAKLKGANKPERVLIALSKIKGLLMAGEMGEDQDDAIRDIERCIELVRQLKKVKSHAQLATVVSGAGFLREMGASRIISTSQAARAVGRVIGRATIAMEQPTVATTA